MYVSTVQPVRTRPATGLWFLVVAGTLWGTGGLLGSVLGREAGLSPLAVAAYRLVVGGGLIVAFVLVTRRSLPRGRAAWRRVVTLGLLAAFFQATYFAAVSYTAVSLATLLTIGATPVLVLVAEAVTGRRRIGTRALGVAGLAVLGLALLVGVPGGDLDPRRTMIGAGFALLSAAGFGAITWVGTTPVAGLDEMAGTGAAFTLGGLVLLPLAVANGGLGFTPSAASLGLLALFALAPTAVAWAAYFRGLRDAAAGTAALMALLEPLVGTALAVLLLGERLGPAGIAGAALLIVALVLENAPERPAGAVQE